MTFEHTESGLRLDVRIQTPLGLHAKPAARLAEEIQIFNADIAVQCGKNMANAKSILDLLTLGAVPGSELFFYAKGEDADACLQRIAELFSTGFKEYLWLVHSFLAYLLRRASPLVKLCVRTMKLR